VFNAEDCRKLKKGGEFLETNVSFAALQPSLPTNRSTQSNILQLNRTLPTPLDVEAFEVEGIGVKDLESR